MRDQEIELVEVSYELYFSILKKAGPKRPAFHPPQLKENHYFYFLNPSKVPFFSSTFLIAFACYSK